VSGKGLVVLGMSGDVAEARMGDVVVVTPSFLFNYFN
jgi:hypothetical protein